MQPARRNARPSSARCMTPTRRSSPKPSSTSCPCCRERWAPASRGGYDLGMKDPHPMSAVHWLTVEPLEAHAFLPFGDVIEAGRTGNHRTINEGFAERFDDLARLDTGREGGR